MSIKSILARFQNWPEEGKWPASGAEFLCG